MTRARSFVTLGMFAVAGVLALKSHYGPLRICGRRRRAHTRDDAKLQEPNHERRIAHMNDIGIFSSARLDRAEAPEDYDLVILGGGTGSTIAAWTFAAQGQRVAVIERKYIRGSCPNIACLPSKNIIHSAKVASYLRRSQEFGILNRDFAVDMRCSRAQTPDDIEVERLLCAASGHFCRSRKRCFRSGASPETTIW
jgi:hypothetical protein